ncbi:PilZ domain-containing protein [Acidobacteria bacterium AH-259-D05]|nr:PilZ domain-containing protein [Acidobacteria bacterium AH-259-D05]
MVEAKRTAKRFGVQATGTVTFSSEGEEWKRKARSRDISASGAYLVTDLRPPVGESVRIHLQLEESDAPFEAVGTVVRVDDLPEDEYGFAVKFEQITDLG